MGTALMWFLRRSCAISRTGAFAVAEITGLVITSRAFMAAPSCEDPLGQTFVTAAGFTVNAEPA